MKITENDVRLMRRILVALKFGDKKSAIEITKYLRKVRNQDFVLPSQQSVAARNAYLNRLNSKEQWLAKKYGCILLPKYKDCIFLNSKWANPYTLYVRLVEPVKELGELGKIHWLPENKKEHWQDIEENNQKEYLKQFGK